MLSALIKLWVTGFGDMGQRLRHREIHKHNKKYIENNALFFCIIIGLKEKPLFKFSLSCLFKIKLLLLFAFFCLFFFSINPGTRQSNALLSG